MIEFSAFVDVLHRYKGMLNRFSFLFALVFFASSSAWADKNEVAIEAFRRQVQALTLTRPTDMPFFPVLEKSACWWVALKAREWSTRKATL